MTESVCQTCGGPLPANKAPGQSRKFCSERCRKRQYDLACVDCGGRVSGTDPGKMADRAEPVCTACAPSHYAQWTCDAIVHAIQAWAEQHGEPPAATDWHSSDETHPWFSQVLFRFGTWNDAIRAAGFEPRPVGWYFRPGSAERTEAVVELYRSGLTIVQVAERLGISDKAVWRRLVVAGEPRRPAGPRRKVAA